MVELTGDNLTIEQVVSVARRAEKVDRISPEAVRRMRASRARVEAALRDDAAPVYGVTTGFGPLARVRIAPEQARQLSRNLILSHVSGVGPPLPADIVRAMMLIRVNTFAKGLSGVRPELAPVLGLFFNLFYTLRQSPIFGTGYGHGYIELVKLPDGSGLWMTSSRYLTPAGTPLQAKGLEPDVLVVATDQFDILTEKHVKGAPALVVEVLSTGTQNVDQTIKRDLYDRAGVREYWIVDPRMKRVVVYARGDRHLEPWRELSAEVHDTLTTPLLPGFSLALADYFR